MSRPNSKIIEKNLSNIRYKHFADIPIVTRQGSRILADCLGGSYLICFANDDYKSKEQNQYLQNLPPQIVGGGGLYAI